LLHSFGNGFSGPGALPLAGWRVFYFFIILVKVLQHDLVKMEDHEEVEK
jgi:hypothetical protein